MKRQFAVNLAICLLVISCQGGTDNNKLPKEPSEDNIKVEKNIVIRGVLKDTIGLYRISNVEAKEFVIEMSELLFDMEKAMNNNDTKNFFELMVIMRKSQRKQGAIQSKLTKEERKLFNFYTQNRVNKLGAFEDSLSNN